MIGFIIRGECDVCRDGTEDSRVIINTLGAGDSFGILTVLGAEEFPTVIYSRRSCSIVFITKESFVRAINSSPRAAMNVMKFLTERIVFLNKKIATVTLGSVDARLASFLLSEAAHNKNQSFIFNFKKCSECISVGRTSVYRSMEFLKSKGYIKAEGKTITILDSNKLEDIIK